MTPPDAELFRQVTMQLRLAVLLAVCCLPHAANAQENTIGKVFGVSGSTPSNGGARRLGV